MPSKHFIKNNFFTVPESPQVFFEDTPVGRMKKEVWEMPFEEVKRQLTEDYEIPSESEFGKAGCYIQTTARAKQIEKRRKNDIVIVPIGSTENHGMHANSGLDTFQCSMIIEGVRRYTAKKGCEVNLAFNPLNYGGHPYHHIGMPGTIIMPDDVVKETIVAMMAGLWNDGYRKIILVNNHGQTWNLEGAIQEFCKRYQLPGIYRLVEWHRAVREFFIPIDRPNNLETHFIHADEAETSCGLLMFKDMIDMSQCEDGYGKALMKDNGYIDTSCDTLRRPATWGYQQGQNAIELKGTPKGSIGVPSISTAEKAMRPILAICKYLTMLCEDILEQFPAGTVPPTEEFTMRTAEEMAPFLKEPLSEGWQPIDALPRRGFYEHL